MAKSMEADSDGVATIEDGLINRIGRRICFQEVEFGVKEVLAVVELLHSKSDVRLDFEFDRCRGQTAIVVTTAMTLETIGRIRLNGLDLNTSAALGTCLMFNQSLRRIRLEGCLTASAMSAILGGLSENKYVDELGLDLQCP